MRAVSRTTLRLGDLIEIPIGIANATSSRDVRLDTAITATGRKRQQVFIDPEGWQEHDIVDPDTGDVERITVPTILDDDACSKGVFVGDTFHPIAEDEIAKVRADQKLDAVEVLEFIDYRRVPTDRLVGSYWIQPDPGFAKPQATLMAAMRKAGRAMLVKFNVRDRQHLGVIRVRKTPGGDALLLNGVAFAASWNEPDEQVLAASNVQVADSAVTAALTIIEHMSGDGEAFATARDELIPAMESLIEQAVNRPLEEEAAAQEGEQVAEADALAAAAAEVSRA